MTDPPTITAPSLDGDPVYWGLTHGGSVAGAVRVQTYRGLSFPTTRWPKWRRRSVLPVEVCWHEIVIMAGDDVDRAQLYSDYFDGPYPCGSRSMVDDWADYWMDETRCCVVPYDDSRWGRARDWFAEWDDKAVDL